MTDINYDLIGFAESLELELEDVADLFTQYLIEVKDHVNELTPLLEVKDFTRLEAVVHSIKGISGNLWINDVFHVAQTFDDLLKEDRTEDAGLYVNNLIMLIDAAEIKIRKIFADANIELC